MLVCFELVCWSHTDVSVCVAAGILPIVEDEETAEGEDDGLTTIVEHEEEGEMDGSDNNDNHSEAQFENFYYLLTAPQNPLQHVCSSGPGTAVCN